MLMLFVIIIIIGCRLSKAQKKNLKRAQKRREKHGNGDEENGDDRNGDVHEPEELTAAQKESRLSEIAREYAVPGRPSSGEISIILCQIS
jgi:hypothetical protein